MAEAPSVGSKARIFYSKAVRDLHWTLASPHVLSDGAECSAVPDEWCDGLVARSMAWLRALDADPTPLEQWLREQRSEQALVDVCGGLRGDHVGN